MAHSIVTMRVLEETKTLWQAAAKQSGLSLTAYISMCVDDAQGLPVPSVTPLTESGITDPLRKMMNSEIIQLPKTAARFEALHPVVPQIVPSRVVSTAKNARKPAKVRDRGPQVCEHRIALGSYCARCRDNG